MLLSFIKCRCPHEGHVAAWILPLPDNLWHPWFSLWHTLIFNSNTHTIRHDLLNWWLSDVVVIIMQLNVLKEEGVREWNRLESNPAKWRRKPVERVSDVTANVQHTFRHTWLWKKREGPFRSLGGGPLCFSFVPVSEGWVASYENAP